MSAETTQFLQVTRRTLALLLLVLGTAQAATATLAELEQATRLNPRSAEAWDRYGQALARGGRYPEAHQAFTQALRLAPESKHVLYHVALAYAWSNNYAEAARRYAQLVARYPHDAALRIDYGQTLAWDQKYPQAREQYLAVLAREPKHVEALRHLGILAAWEGKYAESLEALARAAEFEPHNLRVLTAQAEVQSWAGDLAKAAATFRRATELAPKNAELQRQLAQVQLWQGRLRDARDSYQRALALEGHNVSTYLGLVRSLTEMGEYLEADKVLRAAQAQFPTDARIGKELAGLAAKRQLDIARVVEYLEPLVFVIVLSVIYLHLRRYRRVLPYLAWWMKTLFYAVPLLALAAATAVVVVVSGQAYYYEVRGAWQLLELLGMLAMIAVVLAFVWLLRFQRPHRRQVVLAIGAHPDDIEFGCGATLMRYREEGCQTHALILTGGERGHAAPDAAQTRAEEANASARLLAFNSVEMRDFPDTQLHTQREALRNAIESAVQKLEPDLIFTHTPHDLHSDHRSVFEATREAARGPCTILAYENPNTPAEFNPGFYVDIGDYLDDKIAAIARHKTQAGKPYTDPEVIRHSAGFRGTQARVKFAEAFEVVRVLEKAPVA